MSENLEKVLDYINETPRLKEKHYELSIGSHIDVIAFIKETGKKIGIDLTDNDFAPESHK